MARFLTKMWVLAGVLLGHANYSVAGPQVEFDAFQIPETGRIVVPVMAGESLAGVAGVLDEATGGALSAAATEAEFTGETNATLTLYGVAPYSRIDLVGLGDGPVDRNASNSTCGPATE